MNEMINLLWQESRLHRPDLYPLHPRAKLRCHSHVVNELLKRFVLDGLTGDPDVSTIMGIPVTVDETMEPGTWMLIAGEGTI